MGEAAPPEPTLHYRRIDYQPQKRPFNGFVNNKGFKLVCLNPNPNPEPPHKPSGSGKKCEKSSELTDIGLDPELNLEITFRRIGAGLRNLGNTCFLNSVVQCLTYTEPLAAYLQSGKHQNNCRTAGFCALCAIQKHVSRALQSTGRILEPKDLVSNLRCISRNFRNARQEDAHEYMVNLLESMHKCCLPSGVPTESDNAYDKSLVHKIFGGRLRSQVKCMQCSFCSNKFEPFLDLSLEIAKADSVHKALAHFTSKEQLDGGAKEYQCQQCKQKVKALKQLTVHKAPHVLAVHLKRFSAHSPGQKIDKKIAFGPTLDLKPFVTGTHDGDLNYTLYGVLVHAGWSTRSGHYYCFVRTSSGMWYNLDDNQVYQVNERKVLEQKAYMLFYVRDRRSFIPKKPVDIAPKENVSMNAILNGAYPKLNGVLKEKVQNDLIEKKTNGSASAAVTVITTAPKETPSKETPLQNLNGKMAIDNLGHKDSQPENSQVVPQTKDPLKDNCTNNIKSVGHKGGSLSTFEVNGHAPKIVLCNDGSTVVKDRKEPGGTVLPECNVPQDSLHKKESSDSVAMKNPTETADQPPNGSILSITEDTCKIDGTNSEMCGNKTIPIATIAEESSKVNTISSQENRIEESQVGDPSKKTGDATIEETRENGDTTKNKRRVLKAKRKLFKCQFATTSLSSNIIFGVGLHKQKKKPKRRDQKKSPNVKHISDENDLPSNLEQSTVIDHSTLSPEKKANCGSVGETHNLSTQNISVKEGSLPSCVISNEFRDRVLDGTAVNKPQLKQCAAKGPGNSEAHQIESRQSDAMSLLTRGLEETVVARWDGTHSAKRKQNAAKTMRIGYVGDEWDEEYDRGKRKKIKTFKADFGGPNVFQEIANSRLKLKQQGHNNISGNGPLRI
ncbi:hypothetical protein ABFS83_11G032100 [Erythranthe nasuta]